MRVLDFTSGMLVGIISILTILMSSSCVTLTEKHVDLVFIPYVKIFNSTFNQDKEKIKKLDIKFSSFPDKTIGTCQPGIGVIRISPDYWYSSTIIEKTALIFHELTHCLCEQYNSSHDTRRREDNCPESIMNISLPSRKCLNKHWLSYMTDLKRKCIPKIGNDNE